MSIASTFKAIVVGSIVLASACPALAQGKREITIGLSSTSFATAALRIGQEIGLFAKYNLEPKFVVTDGSGAALSGLMAGSFNLGAIGLPELVVAQSRGQKVVAVAATRNGFATSLVLSKALADKIGISPTAPVAERLKALDGHLLATVSATANGTVAYKLAAQSAGANMRLTYMAQPAMQAALESGSIEGYFSSAPFWAFPIVNGKAVLWIDGAEVPSAPAITGLLLAMRSYADANPDTMKSLKAIIAEVGKAVTERPAEVKIAVAKLYPSVESPILDLLFANESRAWITAEITPAAMAREIDLLKMTGYDLPKIESIPPAAMLYP